MTNDEIRMTNQIPMTNDRMTKPEGTVPAIRDGFDLEERTARYGEAIIGFAKRIPVSPVTRCLIEQLVASGTSIGANYGEANDAESKKDFRHKIGICRKESKETKHWLRMIATAVPEMSADARKLYQEAKELNLIFGKIRRSTE
jgi:four helix bundle protein